MIRNWFVWLQRLRKLSRDRLRGVKVEFKTESKGLKTRRAYGLSSSLKVGRLETKEQPMFQSVSKGWKRPMSQLEAVRHGESPRIRGRITIFVLFRPSADWVRPTHIRAI